MEFWTAIGTAAAVCGAVSLIPEVIKAYRTHHLQDVSWGMLFLMFSSSILWGSYGLHIQDVPLVMSAGTNMLMQTALIVMKKHYGMTRKTLKEHLSKRSGQKLVPALETETAEVEERE